MENLPPETVKACRQCTGDGQGLWTLYRRCSGTIDISHETVRDCRQFSEDSKGLHMISRRLTEAVDILQEVAIVDSLKAVQGWC